LTRVVLDADFISSFLKIGRLALVLDYYRTESLLIPPAVRREVGWTQLSSTLEHLDWVRVEAPDAETLRDISGKPELQGLGAGEREAIALSLQAAGSILLMNDNQARARAARLGLDPVSIPTFLLACKQDGVLARDAVATVIQELREKDRYGFRKEVLDLLLS
jgi:predicted nucleic acid-binding protein